MTYFEDLSGYSYCDDDIVELGQRSLSYRPRYERINVGWLAASHRFETGGNPEWFAGALLDILAGPRVNVMRGFHRCEFCPAGRADPMISVEHSAGTVWLGNAELRVPAEPGVMFGGPSLIWHYVTAHSYRPPTAFIDAVRAYDPGWATTPSRWISDDHEQTA